MKTVNKLIVILSLLFLVGCSSGNTQDEGDRETAIQTEEYSADDEILTQEERREKIERSLDVFYDHFGHISRIVYDEDLDAITINYLSSTFSDELAFMKSSKKDLTDWETLRSSFVNVSKAMSEGVDENIAIILLDPENEESRLLEARDGEIVYDYFEAHNFD